MKGCSMEHDDGDLGAVVRASSFYSKPLRISPCDSNIRPIMGDKESANGKSSQFSFGLRTFSAVELQSNWSNGFYNGNLLRSESTSSSVFENIETTSSIYAATAESPSSSTFSSVISTQKKKTENEQRYGCSSISFNGKEVVKHEFCQNLDQIKPDMSKLAANLSSPPRSSLQIPHQQDTNSDAGLPKPLLSNYQQDERSNHSTSEKEGDCCSSRIQTDSTSVDSLAKTASSKIQGSKRRKTQQKRIACVPASGGSFNKPGGEGVPSDLWAWRKYGQKPIKGSPYPRGYYRCSSSKGCPARKQVERSNTDPTMLVITYACDHNHAWPTHRNALAGSTRHNMSADKKTATQCKDLENNNINNNHVHPVCTKKSHSHQSSPAGENPVLYNPINIVASGEDAEEKHASNSLEIHHHVGESNLDIVEPNDQNAGFHLFRSDYMYDDFFADLGEVPDYLKVFARHFADDKSDDETAASTVVDPFNLFNWSSESFVESKKGNGS
eukprot:Gb_05176 [translate_table: standard]